jgi:hypothetical protein
MPAAVLITLGVLALLDSYSFLRFHETAPVLLLVIGCVLLVSRTGSTEGHIQPGWIQPPVAPPPTQQWTPGADNPPSSSGQDDSQVKS